MNNSVTAPPTAPFRSDLGGWNLYFILKLLLLMHSSLHLYPLANLTLAAFLLLPLPWYWLHWMRRMVAIPFGVVLIYRESWLPEFDTLLSHGSQIGDFSSSYLLALADRFINWPLLATGFVVITAYLLLANWIRFSSFTLLALIWLNLAPFISAPQVQANNQTAVSTASSAAEGAGTSVIPAGRPDQPPTDAQLNRVLADFHAKEQARRTRFPATLPADAKPFDLLVINICSLSWSDLNASQLTNHPLWQRLDILMTRFNSATSYSGPASISLLRASCGQEPFDSLYQTPRKECLLFDNLAALGFESRLMLDHQGQFGNYLAELRKYGGLMPTPMNLSGITPRQVSFDGSPVYDDGELLGRWLHERANSPVSRTATLFNLIALHDGNRYKNKPTLAPYRPRLRQLLDKLNDFFTELEHSGRRVMVVLVPEHGAALTGDRLQIPGLRVIPSEAITRVPVGVKFVGLQAPAPAKTIRIATPTSYLALSELVARTLSSNLFSTRQIEWNQIVRDLPETAVVSQNQGTTVMDYQGKSYIRLNSGEWTPIPPNESVMANNQRRRKPKHE